MIHTIELMLWGFVCGLTTRFLYDNRVIILGYLEKGYLRVKNRLLKKGEKGS